MEANLAIDTWGAKVLGDPAFKTLRARVKVVVRGEGVWVFDCIGIPRVVPADVDADCTITVSKDTLAELAGQRINPQAAYLEGKLAVTGDYGAALRFSALMFGEAIE